MKKTVKFATAVLLANSASAGTFDDQTLFTDSLDNFTVIDTSDFIGNTTFEVSPLIAGADFYGPDALVREDDLILNGQGFHGVGEPHVGINFSVPVNAVGVTSNAVDGGTIQMYTGPDGTGNLINAVGFGGGALASFTGVIENTVIGSVIFTCEFDADLRRGLRDPVFGFVDQNADTDEDGVLDGNDNCLVLANPDQTDTDSDGYGNRCDADFNNDCTINFLDFTRLAEQFLSVSPLHDLTGDGTINFLDVAAFSNVFFGNARTKWYNE